ncbi:MAG: ECF transporter S component [Clostridia bacterium]|nr:ECF transporter S component [Clostridia bacterium]
MKTGNRRDTTVKLTLFALLTALLIVLGYVNIPQPAGLSITFNMIPVAIAAIAIGLGGGALMGGVFGLISFLQCFGLVGFSGMGAVLVGISPVLCFIQRFVSRVLVGVLAALVYRALYKRMNAYLSCMITGFSAAFFNTLFFMSSLVLLFGNTEYIQGLMAGRGVIAFIIASVGINAVVEMIVAAAVTGAVGAALKKARLI